jgi:hypothetical protein
MDLETKQMKEFAKTTAIAKRLDDLIDKMRNEPRKLGHEWRNMHDDTLWQFLKLNKEYDRLWEKIEKKLNR